MLRAQSFRNSFEAQIRFAHLRLDVLCSGGQTEVSSCFIKEQGHSSTNDIVLHMSERTLRRSISCVKEYSLWIGVRLSCRSNRHERREVAGLSVFETVHPKGTAVV
jgi:hypothetical protein